MSWVFDDREETRVWAVASCDLAHSYCAPFVYNRNMVPFGKSVCLLMALLVLSMPLVACALPGEEMSAAEQDCCLHMSDECGSSQMSDAHTCCTRTSQLDTSALKTTVRYMPAAPDLVAHIVFGTAPAIANILPGQQLLPNDSASPPGAISVLRI